MDVVRLIEQSQAGKGSAVLGRQFGLDDAQSKAAIEQLAPVVMAGLRRNSQSAVGVSGLLKAVASGNHARYLDGDDEHITDDGNAILGHVFGSKDVSRSVAQKASSATGIDSSVLKQVLPVVAAMVMGALAKNMTGGQSAGANQGGAGGLGNILNSVLGGGQPGQQGGGLGDILGQVLGGGAKAGQMGASGKGGLGDMLSQVLTGGGGPAQQQAQSSNPDIGGLLNSIFGGNASPQVRDEATRRASAALSGLLGGGTASASDADRMLQSIGRAMQQR
jgi:hypothetical protein